MLEKRLRASGRACVRAGGQPSERARTKAAVSQLQLQRANTTSAAPSPSACGSFAVGSWDVDSSAVRRAIHSSIHPDTVRGSLSLRPQFGPFITGNLKLDLCLERARPRPAPRWSE